MIEKFTFGKPFDTESVVAFPKNGKTFTDDEKSFPFGKISVQNGFNFDYALKDETRIFGLGENLGGINKRGRKYVSWCSDDPNHTEEKQSLYGAHNFIVIQGEETFGLYFDYPGKLSYDAGFTERDRFNVHAEESHISVYVIFPENDKKQVLSIVEQFRKIIGESYLPPFWATGFMQSRWGYGSEDDLKTVFENHRNLNIPLDAIFLDIDYMDNYRDFSINKNNFKDFKASVQALKEKNVHVVPIIDAGIKVEDLNTTDASLTQIDSDGIKKDFFCKKQDGSLFAAGVWPGLSHFTDFLNPEARKWFGSLYKKLTDCGIDGFWNDMNEPALFYSEDGIKNTFQKVRKLTDDTNPNVYRTWDLKNAILSVQNNMEDYKSFYHQVPKDKAGAFAEEMPKEFKLKEGCVAVRHDKIHNLYGYNMTRAAAEYFTENLPKKTLMISRSSFIGMHRYSGIWTGDNFAWWSHVLLLIKQLPSLNMCGFLYTGCDLGGFGCDTSRDLLLRYLSIGVFTPLMRNHSALGTREQECYRFENPEDFRGIINFRYRMLPYLYNLLEDCAKNGKMYFKPLCFEWPEDPICNNIEDQLVVGDDIMIAPVYTQNATGRTVYLPEDMICLTCGQGTGLDSGEPVKNELSKGVHYIEMPLNKIVFFKKKGAKISVVKPALTTAELDVKSVSWW